MEFIKNFLFERNYSEYSNELSKRWSSIRPAPIPMREISKRFKDSTLSENRYN